MKINVLAYDVFIWTNQIRVNGESARASFDWLQEGGGPTLPSRLQNSASERIVPKLQAQVKERRCSAYRVISGKVMPCVRNTLFTHLCNSFILHTETYSSEWIRFAVLNTTVFACKLPFTDLQGFWRHFSAKNSGQKCKRGKNVGQMNTDHIYFKLIWSCSFNTWFALPKHSTMMQVLFSWAYNLIYTFTKKNLRMQIYCTLAMSRTLSQILPCVIFLT